jgi:GNAT superfamily N-acetyltransferase
MAAKPELVNITMVRETLEDLPDYPLPRPWSIRLYEAGDDAAFDDIWVAADENGQAHPGLFAVEFTPRIADVPARMHFLLDEKGRAVGTATAWSNDSFEGGSWGNVHWVAIKPEAQGKGLAKPLMAAVLKRLKALGHTRAYLVTQTVRLTAISLYLDLGFKPLAKTDEQKAHWKGVHEKLAKRKTARKK